MPASPIIAVRRMFHGEYDGVELLFALSSLVFRNRSAWRKAPLLKLDGQHQPKLGEVK
jgi:hypothetical protein